MVPKLLRRLATRSASASGGGETLAGQRPGIEGRDRMGTVGNPLPSGWVRMYVWRRDRGRCVRCAGRKGVWFDYIVPVRAGGSHTEQNIRLMCGRCLHGEGASARRRRWRA